MACRSLFEPFGGDTDFFKHGGDDALAVFEQGEQEVDGLDLGVAEFGGALLRLLDCLLRLDGEFFPTNGHEKQLLAASFSAPSLHSLQESSCQSLHCIEILFLHYLMQKRRRRAGCELLPIPGALLLRPLSHMPQN